MKTSTTPDNDNSKSTTPSLSFLDEGVAAEWFTNNGKSIGYGIAILVTSAFLFYFFTGSHANQKEEDYLQASRDFALFIKAKEDSPSEKAAFTELKSLINTHPELHALYDGAIAQKLFNQSKSTEALQFANPTLKRIEIDNLSFYHSFASTTLLINTEKYKEALSEALSLHDKMGEAINATPDSFERPFGEELFALNLFRIAMLQQQLGEKKEEKQSWQIWKQYAGLTQSDTPLPFKVNAASFRAVIQQLAIGSIALPDYIAYREKAL